MTGEAKFVRYQASSANHRGTFPGIFGLANGLAHDGRLSEADFTWWRNANDWCNTAYPDPSTSDPSIYDRTVNPTAQAWFKVATPAPHLLAKVDGYLSLLHRYGVECERVASDDPGTILYEDEFQIVVVPH
ncbi:hypothetical protein [Arthrobacter castelli]|uniref:hypothetical protein n=1 Tax=Arthrobacter castelli TaxID=271431 RepID=UPI0009D72AD2|nr:hypothetical protein [Arthrobacter castelli]